MKKGMSSHHSAAMITDTWLTPPHIISALGPFDLDPCSPIGRPWDTAKEHYTILDDGLSKQWFGRVWCNPPYGKEGAKWLQKCAEHRNATALVFARTETAMFFDHVWGHAHSILFIKGRLHFHKITGERAKANSGAPSVLISYDEFNTDMLRDSGIDGKLVTI